DCPDEIQEDQAEQPEIDCKPRPVIADFRAGNHCHEDPRGQRFSAPAVHDQREYNQPSDDNHEEVVGLCGGTSLMCRQTHQTTASTPNNPITKSNRWNSVLSVSFLSHSSPSFCPAYARPRHHGSEPMNV